MTTPHYTVYVLTTFYPPTGMPTLPVGVVVVDHIQKTFLTDFFDVEEALTWKARLLEIKNLKSLIQALAYTNESTTIGFIREDIVEDQRSSQQILDAYMDDVMQAHLLLDDQHKELDS